MFYARSPTTTKLAILIQVDRTIFAPLKFLRIRRIVSLIEGAETLGQNTALKFKCHNSVIS